MPDLNATLTLAYGDTTPVGSVPKRDTYAFSLAYTELSCKTVAVPANTTAYPVALDSVSAPKFLFARARNVDVTIELVSGISTISTSLAVASGWVCFANPNGQPVSALTITTPVSPTTGAHVEILAFE